MCSFVMVLSPLISLSYSILGMNVLSSEGEDWKRHRRIIAPAFNPTTYLNVWETTVNVYKEITEKEYWEGKETVTVNNFNLITHKVSVRFYLDSNRE